jgi:feruloyl esterase
MSDPLFDARRTLAACVTALVLAGPASAAAPDARACGALDRNGLFADTKISSARLIPEDPTKKLPAFCEVVGVISPAPGSGIGVVYRLPQNWNGKFLGLGGGGWAGNIKLDIAEPGLTRGYATAQTDGGHPGTGVRDTSWANDITITDFAFRAVHQMTVIGKSVVAKYYGRDHSRAYFHGCSTGGRQGLMEVQRYPRDYDGVIAGAPVYSLVTQTSAIVRNQAFAREGAQLTTEQLEALNAASLQACDTKDGLKDGIVTDPRLCDFDPGVLACKENSKGLCLRPPQLAAVRRMYAGVKTSAGETVAPPLTRGGEADWARFIAATSPPTPTSAVGIDGLRGAIFGNPDFELDAFDPDRDFRTVRDSGFARQYEAADPDISAFVERGGKLLLWHGWDDAGPSPFMTIDYFERMRQVTGPKVKSVDDGARLFIAPGVYHCRNGPGADQFDLLGTIDAWVEQDAAPESMLATRTDGSLSRPLCRYPALPRYKGRGKPAEAASFVCK